MTKLRWVLTAIVVLIAAVIGVVILLLLPRPGRCDFLDEAKCKGLTTADFPQAFDDYFRDMDGGVSLEPNEVAGRNTWMIWTAGNSAFWDHLANNSFGAVDMLKILSSYPSQYDTEGRYKFSRDNRFSWLGLINEPGFVKATKPDEHGLWLDERVAPPEPFDEAVYGKASGIIGMRLFPNPAFDGDAKKKWDADRYYNDKQYYLNPELVRPYRVGISCAFCHVGPNPVKPPDDPEHPEWENLSNNVGAQYFWVGRIFAYDLEEDNFVWQLFNSPPAGSLDTSMIAPDNILNPRTMNAIYNVGPRLEVVEALKLEEELVGDTLRIPGTLPIMAVPHVLKDGSDSVGIPGALARVYLNIGEFHQEWTRHFNLLLGGKRQTPFKVETAQKNSVYWLATEERVGNLAAFFVKSATPHLLKDAPGGQDYLSTDQGQLTRGKIAFAENCAACHSSKQPPEGVVPDSPEQIQWFRDEVVKPDFLENNFLSDERRYSVAELGTNACSSLATNSLEGQVWASFSSKTFKSLPAVGRIEVYNPFTKQTTSYEMPGGGRGYTRTPSLVSMWSTAPFLLNNSVGKFTGDPSVAGRMAAFDDGIDKLLTPEKRRGVDSIYRTTEESFIVVNEAFLPKPLQTLLGLGKWLPGWMPMSTNELRIGPIPKGTPVGLLASLDLEISKERIPELIKVLRKTVKTLKRIKKENLSTEQSTELLRSELATDLLALSKCPDFITDRGHEYGSDLPDGDKKALIEFLKTF